jgi:ribose 1,5-bisphosphate isomerase
MAKNFPKEIEQIKKDIEELKIQGATNVAISTFEGMKLFLRNKWGNDSIKDLVKSALEVGEYLSNARENEPLARNGVLYIKKKSENLYMEKMDIRKAQDRLLSFIDEYLDIISGSKKELVKNSADDLREFENVLTHCHSSTVVELFKGMSRGKKKSEFGVVCTETRPKYQGRVTAKALLDIGIDTTLISDSAAESFAIGRGSRPVDAIFLGCDQITRDGYMINKIGSWGIAMAAHYASKPVYVVTPLLKMDPKISASEVEIEVREEEELWSNAPKGLEMYNPSFEIIDNILITGYITEEGILKANELEEAVKRRYQWLFEE